MHSMYKTIVTIAMENRKRKTETEGGNGKRKRKAEKYIMPIHCFALETKPKTLKTFS